MFERLIDPVALLARAKCTVCEMAYCFGLCLVHGSCAQHDEISCAADDGMGQGTVKCFPKDIEDALVERD